VQIRTPGLPYLSLTFISESTLIAAGHDCQPVLFSGDASGWALSASLDSKSASGTGASGGRVVSGAGPGRLNTEAFNMFRTADTRGQSRTASAGSTSGGIEVGADGMLLTVHQNSITHVEAYEWGSGGTVSKVVTAGKDGRLVIWDVAGKK
jgi:actin related protein 2/3 complex subunit 1A/1B